MPQSTSVRLALITVMGWFTCFCALAQQATESACAPVMTSIHFETEKVSLNSLSQDGSMMTVSTVGGSWVIDTISGEEILLTPPVEAGYLFFSPRGDYLVRKDHAGLDIIEGRQVDSPPLHRIEPFQDCRLGRITFSNEDRLLGVTCNTSNETHIRVFEAATAEEIFRLKMRRNNVQIALDGQELLMALRPQGTDLIQVWDLVGRERIQRIFKEHSDGKSLFLAGPLADYPNRRMVADLDGRGALRLWSLDDDEAPHPILLEPAAGIENIAFSSQNGLWASTNHYSHSRQSSLALWRQGRLHCLSYLPLTSIRSLAFSGDGERIAVQITETSGQGSRIAILPTALGERSAPPVELTAVLSQAEVRYHPSIVKREVDPLMAHQVPYGSGDFCHVYAIGGSTKAGLVEFGRFETVLGEERLTEKDFPIPGTDLTATVAVYYTDESINSLDGDLSMYLALVVGPSRVENPFHSLQASIAEITYTEQSGKVRVRKRLPPNPNPFVIGLECDTTVKRF